MKRKNIPKPQLQQDAGSNMKKRENSKHTPQASVADIPKELIQHIQSLLPPKEAARTCVLSKSWGDAWSTIPTLRFPLIRTKWGKKGLSQGEYNKLIHSTLKRYRQRNLPIQTFYFESLVKSVKSASVLANQWIRPLSTTSCLNHLSVKIQMVDHISFALPDEILCNKKLTTLSLMLNGGYRFSVCSINASIKCVSLRVLELKCVDIPDQNILDNLLSTCSLLEKFHLVRCNGFKTVKVKNLLHLHDLNIELQYREYHVLEIENVPNLGLFRYIASNIDDALPFNLESLGTTVRELCMKEVMIDEAFLEMIQSKFVSLERLSLVFYTEIKIFAIKSGSLKKLKVDLSFIKRPVDLPVYAQIYAPNLVVCEIADEDILALSFPTIDPERVKTKRKKGRYGIHTSVTMEIMKL